MSIEVSVADRGLFMRMHRTKARLHAAAIVVLAAVVSLAACGRSKVDRLGEARAALAAADSAGAALYAPELFQEASDLLVRAEQQFQAGNRDDARDLAGECSRLSRRAVKETEENRVHAREEAEASLSRLEDAVERARDAVSDMMLVTPPELAQARADLDRLEKMLTGVKRALEHGLYLDAREMAETAESEAVSIEEGAKVAAYIGAARDSASRRSG